jgi:hypothetical protein
MTIPEYKVEAALAVMFKNTIEELLTDQQAKDLRDRVRRGLEAAEAAQEPPQIEVTEEMAEAGAGVLARMVCEGCPYDTLAVLIYRKMRALEKKPLHGPRAFKRKNGVVVEDERSGKERRVKDSRAFGGNMGRRTPGTDRRQTQGDER